MLGLLEGRESVRLRLSREERASSGLLLLAELSLLELGHTHTDLRILSLVAVFLCACVCVIVCWSLPVGVCA